jgi:DNA-binding NarL/FixJ family response regulator
MSGGTARGPSIAEVEIEGVEYVVLGFPSADELDGRLSPSELEVARMLLRGASYREIARRRRRSIGTIAKQVSAVFRKLGVRSRAELAAQIARRGA